MGGPGPTDHNPFARLLPPHTPGPLGCNDSGDPNTPALRACNSGTLGLHTHSDAELLSHIDPFDFDYLVRHDVLKSHLIQSRSLNGLHPKSKEKHDPWKNQSIWQVGGAVVFRVTQLSEDLDGSPRAYHPPTDASWNGYGPQSGLGKDSLANAVGVPGVTPYAHSKNEQDWALTAGCQLFRDLHTARALEPKAAAAGKPPAPGLDPAAASKAASDAQAAKAELDKIYKKYGATKIADLETQSKSAVCVLYVPGRSKQDSRDDWKHVVSWAGIQTDSSGKPIQRTSGPNKGFFIPSITPGWADAEKHPWVVLNPPQDQLGVNLTNSAVVIKNGEVPEIAFGMVGDKGPKGHLGEVSSRMMSDLGKDATQTGDFIIIQFPQNVSTADIAKPKSVADIQADAKAAFEAWTFENRSGLDLVKELFPPPEQYARAQRDLQDARNYLNAFIDRLQFKLE